MDDQELRPHRPRDCLTLASNIRRSTNFSAGPYGRPVEVSTALRWIFGNGEVRGQQRLAWG
ncbi:hypothetical protein FA13DRAFT_1726896 [Coprinellus micaceus]|uniref:Uncharacterized protein n=1 Tax=Coprinellus micaceus TaxID=71717 RepID=A0A4Y7TQS4_COPMI|nr:hypothetical protein FA13DRAFT_1726896 [Coprinellus micaceus]